MSNTGGNSLAISGIPYDSRLHWQEVFSLFAPDMGGFEGNVNHAAALMAKFGEGRNCIREFFAGKVEIDYPDIWIMHTEAENLRTAPMFHYRSEDKSVKAIVVKKSFLEESSEYDPAVTRIFCRKGDDHVLYASAADYFFLSGVEETHHAVYLELNPDSDEREQRATALTRAEYNALETEWQALAFRIKYAAAYGLAPLVLKGLLAIQRSAAQVRGEQGLPTDNIPFLD